MSDIENISLFKDSDEDSASYCEICECYGEEEYHPIEKSLLAHKCKYGDAYVMELYFNEMIIEEFHKLGLNQTDIDEVYNKARKRLEEKYESYNDRRSI